MARDEPKSPGWRRVLQGALDTVEEHLAQEVHGLEDVLHGVDSACLGEEGERGAASGQGAHVWPGVHKNHAGYCLASNSKTKGCQGPLSPWQLQASQGNAIGSQTSISPGGRSPSSSPGTEAVSGLLQNQPRLHEKQHHHHVSWTALDFLMALPWIKLKNFLH